MIERAVDILRAGGLVAFPTETVYGLGADARNPDAVAKIFAAKGRPATNPLIVHVADVESAKQCAQAWPTIADRLAKAFWPGPLTLVTKKEARIVAAATAGGDTVGLRVPNHPIALQLLRAFGGPLAAPSANRSNRISPTSARHVRDELDGKVDLILDGGDAELGIESTVINLTSAVPTILRPGSITRAQIESVIGPVSVSDLKLDPTSPAVSPGQQATHYSPSTPAYWLSFDDSPPDDGSSVQINIERYGTAPEDAEIWMPSDPVDYAHDFYRVLRDADAMRMDRILIELPPAEPAWAAIRDRILRAAKPWKEQT